MELANATERREAAVAALKKDFNITTGEDIAKVKAELESEVDAAIARVTSALDAM